MNAKDYGLLARSLPDTVVSYVRTPDDQTIEFGFSPNRQHIRWAVFVAVYRPEDGSVHSVFLEDAHGHPLVVEEHRKTDALAKFGSSSVTQPPVRDLHCSVEIGDWLMISKPLDKNAPPCDEPGHYPDPLRPPGARPYDFDRPIAR